MSIAPLAALHVLARLRVGQDVDGEMDALAEPFRSMVARLAEVPVDSTLTGQDRREALAVIRKPLWESMMAARTDRDELVLAVAQIDPEGPLPGPDGDKESLAENLEAIGSTPAAEEEWAPLRLGKLPPVEPFPLDVLPAAAGQMVTEISSAVGCDPSLPAGQLLAVTSGMMGRSASLLLAQNRFASSCLFLASIGIASDGKSPSQGYVCRPVRDLDQELADEFTRDKQAYLDSLKAAPNGVRPGPKPVPRRIIVEDTTMEACKLILAANPRGLLMVLDELAILIGGMNQYKAGKGNDQPMLLKVFSGEPITADRVLNEFNEPTRVPHPSLSIVGNCTPDKFREMFGGCVKDGFLDRWLICFPDRRPKLKSSERRPVSNEAIEGWAAIVRALWNRQMNTETGKACPHVIHPTDKGRAEFDRLYDEHADEMNSADFPEDLHGPWGKLETYAGRFWLILTLLWHAADPTADPDILPNATAKTARDAWRLASYFKSHHRRIRAHLQGKGTAGAPEGVRLVLNWIKGHPNRDRLSWRDLSQAYPPSRGYDRAMMEDALAWLVRQNALRSRRQDDKPRGTPGRKASLAWEIHPDLIAQQNQQIQRNGTDASGHKVDSPEYADSAAPSEEVGVAE
jgi:hypothetical protein